MSNSETLTLQPELSTFTLNIDETTNDKAVVNCLANGNVDLNIDSSLETIHIDVPAHEKLNLNLQGVGLQGPPGTLFDCPDELDESDSVYFYFGWIDVDGGWYIQRQVRLTSATLSATMVGNPDETTFTDAWDAREDLTYG